MRTQTSVVQYSSAQVWAVSRGMCASTFGPRLAHIFELILWQSICAQDSFKLEPSLQFLVDKGLVLILADVVLPCLFLVPGCLLFHQILPEPKKC